MHSVIFNGFMFSAEPHFDDSAEFTEELWNAMYQKQEYWSNKPFRVSYVIGGVIYKVDSQKRDYDPTDTKRKHYATYCLGDDPEHEFRYDKFRSVQELHEGGRIIRTVFSDIQFPGSLSL